MIVDTCIKCTQTHPRTVYIHPHIMYMYVHRIVECVVVVVIMDHQKKTVWMNLHSIRYREEERERETERERKRQRYLLFCRTCRLGRRLMQKICVWGHGLRAWSSK